MALINCPECGGKLSDKAKVCIHCGYPMKVEQEDKWVKKYGLTLDELISNPDEFARRVVYGKGDFKIEDITLPSDYTPDNWIKYALH